MQLFVMRHGQANAFGESDAQRTLTEHGEKEAVKMAKWLTQYTDNIEQIMVSPYKRAEQTAQPFILHPAISATVTTVNFITPEGSAKQVHDYIDGMLANESINSILIISHMPLVSYLVDELTVDSSAPIFQTAAIAHINYDVNQMKGQLVKLIAPNDI